MDNCIALLIITLAWALNLHILGVNNSSNSIGALIGARITSARFARLIFLAGVLAGALIEGHKLSTVLVIQNHSNATTHAATLSILIATLAVVLIATYVKVPLPVTLVIVGAYWGAEVASMRWAPTSQVLLFSLAWALTPTMSATMSFAFFKIIPKLRLPKKLIELTVVSGATSIIGSFYIAYVLGANTVGLISGLIAFAPYTLVSAVAGIFVGVGGFFGRRVCATVGSQFVGLGPFAAAIAQVSGALTIHVLTQVSCPASITQSIVGSIIGIGLAKGVGALNFATIYKVLLLWAATPLLSAAFSCLVHRSLLLTLSYT